MSNFLQLLLFAIFSVLSVQGVAQEIAVSSKIRQIDSLIECHQPNAALLLISKKMNDKSLELNETELKQLKLKKNEALSVAERYEELMNYSKTLIEEYSTDTLSLIRLRLDRALAFEYLEEWKQCEQELLRIKSLAVGFEQTELYGIYLYRTTSFYRVQKKLEMARDFANKSYLHAIKYDFEINKMISTMLLGFLTNVGEYEKERFYYREVLNGFRKLKNYPGMSGMYSSLARVFMEDSEYDSAIIYLDSAICISNENYNGILTTEYFKKSNIYERLNQTDSAFKYLKLHLEEKEKERTIAEKELILGLEYQYEKETQGRELDAKKREAELLEQSNKRLNYIAIVLLILVAIIACLSYFLAQSKKKLKLQNQDLAKSNQTKTLLLQELHHRVKNNLALIISMVGQVAQEGQIHAEPLEELETRIRAISTAQELLFQNFVSDSETQNKIDMAEYLLMVAKSVINLQGREIGLEMEIENVQLNADTSVPIGIILNELITNSLKHAKPISENLLIEFGLSEQNGELAFWYEDNGTNFPKHPKRIGVGSTILHGMAMQLQGSFMREESEYEFKLKIKNDG